MQQLCFWLPAHLSVYIYSGDDTLQSTAVFTPQTFQTTNLVNELTDLRVAVIKWIHSRHPMCKPHTISDRPSLAHSDRCTGVFQVPEFCGTIKWACHQVSAIILRAQCDGCTWETVSVIYSKWQQQLLCLELGVGWKSFQFLQIHCFIHTGRSYIMPGICSWKTLHKSKSH